MALLKLRRNRDRQHGLSADARRFALGTRSLADLVAPAVLEVEAQPFRSQPIVASAINIERYFIGQKLSLRAPLSPAKSAHCCAPLPP